MGKIIDFDKAKERLESGYVPEANKKVQIGAKDIIEALDAVEEIIDRVGAGLDASRVDSEEDIAFIYQLGNNINNILSNYFA